MWARESSVSADARERGQRGGRGGAACIFPSCVDWRRKPSMSSTSSTSSTKTAPPPHAMATMAPTDSELPLPLPPSGSVVSSGLSGGEKGWGA